MMKAWFKGVPLHALRGTIHTSHRAITQHDIEQIQLDARISALEETAKLLEEKQRHSAEAGQTGAAITVQERRKIILTRAKELKEGMR